MASGDILLVRGNSKTWRSNGDGTTVGVLAFHSAAGWLSDSNATRTASWWDRGNTNAQELEWVLHGDAFAGSLRVNDVWSLWIAESQTPVAADFDGPLDANFSATSDGAHGNTSVYRNVRPCGGITFETYNELNPTVPKQCRGIVKVHSRYIAPVVINMTYDDTMANSTANFLTLTELYYRQEP